MLVEGECLLRIDLSEVGGRVDAWSGNDGAVAFSIKVSRAGSFIVTVEDSVLDFGSDWNVEEESLGRARL